MLTKRFLWIACLLLIPGCSETLLQTMDRQASEKIRQRQRDALGESGFSIDTHDHDTNRADHVALDTIGTANDAYDMQPGTRNDAAPPIPRRSPDESTYATDRTNHTGDSDGANGDGVDVGRNVGEDVKGGVGGNVGGNVGGGGTSDAQMQPVVEPMVIDLEGVLAIAIERSREYRDRKEDLFLTALDLLIERHLWGPRFFDTFTTRFVGVPESGDHDQVMEISNSFGVRQRLPYGGEVSITALTSYVNYLRESATKAASGDGSETQTGALTLSATLPLLRGAGVAAREDLIQAERDLVYAVRDFERFRREFLVSISSDYYNLLLGQANLRSRQNQTKRFEQLSLRTQALADAGRESVLEVQRTENRLLQAQAAETSEQQRYSDSLDRFKIRLNLPLATPIEILPVEVVAPDPVLHEAEATQFAMANRLDLQTTRDRVADAGRRLRVAKNDTLPDLDLFASTTARTDGDKQFAGFDLDAGASDYEVGITLDLPLDRRRQWLSYRRAMVLAERAKRDFGLSRDRVIQDVRSAIRQIERARFTLELQERNLVIASRRLLRVQIRSLGPFEYLEAETELIQAQNERDAALRDLRVAMLQYLLNSAQMRVAANGQWIEPVGLVPIEADGKSDAGHEVSETNEMNESGDETS